MIILTVLPIKVNIYGDGVGHGVPIISDSTIKVQLQVQK